jgi:hypothetical protein
MKSKLVALAACLLLGGLVSLAEGQSVSGKRCALAGGVISCGPTAACHCNSGSSTVATPQPQPVSATWCRDRGPTC